MFQQHWHVYMTVYCFYHIPYSMLGILRPYYSDYNMHIHILQNPVVQVFSQD